jgi:hypothetical protein
MMLTLALGAVTASAQTPMAGSNIGQRIVPDDARMVARGGWGMAVSDTTHPGFKNLASLAYLRHVVLKYTGYGELTDSESPNGTRTTSGVYSPGIQFALPVIKSRLGMTAGFSMNGSTRWDAQRDSTWTLADTSVVGGIALSREGTRFKVPLGVAWRPYERLAIAGAINLESGSSLENYNEAFASSGIDPNLKETKDLYQGTSYTLGLQWQPLARLSLGASWTPAYTLEVDRQVKVQGVTARYQTSWDLSLPAEYMAGFQLRLTERWQVGADAQFMPFSEFSGNDAWAEEMYDEYTFGFGLERMKANERRAGMKNLPLRLGANLHRWAYGLGGEPIEELTFSIGTGFGFARDLGQLDVSLSYGMIGDLGQNGVRSNVYRLGVSVTGLEAWW